MKDNKNLIVKILFVVVIMLIIVSTVTLSTYAFFTFYQKGLKNNKIVTGRIELDFIDDEINNINLTNQFPISDALAMNLTNSSENIVETHFRIEGYAGNNTTLKYTVKAIKGEIIPNKIRMSDNQIKLYLTSTTNGQGIVKINPKFSFIDKMEGVYGGAASLGRGSLDTSSNGEIHLADGVVTSETTIHNYILRMWISDDVTISDTYTKSTYCASELGCIGNRNVYGKMYYSLVIKVENKEIE